MCKHKVVGWLRNIYCAWNSWRPFGTCLTVSWQFRAGFESSRSHQDDIKKRLRHRQEGPRRRQEVTRHVKTSRNFWTYSRTSWSSLVDKESSRSTKKCHRSRLRSHQETVDQDSRFGTLLVQIRECGTGAWVRSHCWLFAIIVLVLYVRQFLIMSQVLAFKYIQTFIFCSSVIEEKNNLSKAMSAQPYLM